MLYATPYVSPISGALSVRIMEVPPRGGDRQVDIIAVDSHRTYASEHEVPMSVMSKAFEKRFADGGRFRQDTNWDYPFRGNQIGCRVIRIE